MFSYFFLIYLVEIHNSNILLCFLYWQKVVGLTVSFLLIKFVGSCRFELGK